MTYYREVVADFAHRTQRNLQFIDEAKKRDQEVFETTQLINSMLGLLVFPQQRFVNRIPKTPLSELERQGWPHIKMTAASKKCENLRGLIRKLRNSIAHFNIKFKTDQSRNITGVKVWNISSSGKRDWEADLDLDDLRKIAMRFVKILRDEKLIGQN